MAKKKPASTPQSDFQEEISYTLGCSDSLTSHVIVFVPTKDKDGHPLVDADVWLNVAIQTMSQCFGGATVMAPASGAWYNCESRKVIQETVHMVQSYANFDENLQCFEPIADLLHRKGQRDQTGRDWCGR
jgi:hypothetical protein